MKKSKLNLSFTLLAASAVMLAGCAKPEPLTADNDVACRDNQGRVVDEDLCDGGGGTDSNGMLLFMMMSSNGYKNKYGKYPHGYNPKSYAGKTTKSFGGGSVSRGGFGSSGRGMSAGG
jgi:hypothetical protein